MILIISDLSDKTTDDVINWLNLINKNFIRINSQDNVELKFSGKEIYIETKELKIKLSNISKFWYRRGQLNIKNDLFTIKNEFDKLQSEELDKIIQFLYYKLCKLKHINSITDIDINKLIVNDIAENVCLCRTDDYFFSSKSSLFKLLKESNQKYISKVISGNCVQNFEDFDIYNYTTLLTKDKVKTNFFFPSLVQNYIEKKYELRIFYLDGSFYSMAIFSQKDTQTNIDFRNYNDQKPNRTIPYKLPKNIEIKLDKLMKKLDLNCGSIDMIVTPENEYIFLEVNPVGQFGMISFPCNYNLEKRIAEYL